MDTISEKDTQSADDKKKEKISYIEAIPITDGLPLSNEKK